MQAHDVANLFPMMRDDEYAALVADIHQHGQREPIWLLDGAILDGRNRWQHAAISVSRRSPARIPAQPTWRR